MQLQGKKIIVTGGARGIAASVVRAYAAQGAKIASLDVLDAEGEQTAALINEQYPGAVAYHRCDIANREEVSAVFEAAVTAMGGLDVMANIAGVERTAPAEEISREHWDLIFDVNVRGTLHTNQAAFAHMRDQGGRIINFGSAAGLIGLPGAAHYSASKGAVLAWTRTVAREWARHGITVNAVAPMIWTPMYDTHRAKMSAEQLVEHDRHLASIIPLGGKLGDADRDLAPVMVFLASDGSRFITGQTFNVDGGTVPVR